MGKAFHVRDVRCERRPRDQGHGNQSRANERVARSVETGRLIGPRIYTPGSPIDGPGPDNPKMPIVRARTPDEARRSVDALDMQGADFIKVMSSLSRDSYLALAQRARVIRAVFAGHVPESVTVSQALDARQKSMEHLFGTGSGVLLGRAGIARGAITRRRQG